MNPQIVEGLLREDESPYLEFKESIDLENRKGKAEFLKDILALANSTSADHHTYLLIGVEDKTKKPIGITSFSLAEDQLQQVINDNCKPPISFAFKLVEYQSNSIGVLQIFHGTLKPHTLKTKFGYAVGGKSQEIPDTQVFIRRGSIVQVATPEEIVVMAQERFNDVDQKAQIAQRLEQIAVTLDDVTYYLKEISGEIYRSRPRKQVDRLTEGVFISLISGGLVGWLWGSGWDYAPVASPVLLFSVSLISSTLKVIDYGLTRAVINSLFIGLFLGSLFVGGANSAIVASLLDTGVMSRIVYGSFVGAIAGILVSIFLRRIESIVSR